MKPYYEDESVTIFHADCRDVLPTLEPGSIDLVLTDPPYGITSNAWDKSMDYLMAMLADFKTIVMTASQPYASELLLSGLDRFRHEWIWLKNRGSNFANTVREPMKEHEHVLVFSDGAWTYNPQMQSRSGSGGDRVKHKVAFHSQSTNYREFEGRDGAMLPSERVPSSVQFFLTEVGLHPTQKPLALLSYLVQTYSNVGDTILDPFSGSGTTLRAAKDLGRKAIGIEIEEKYAEIAAQRMSQLAMELG